MLEMNGFRPDFTEAYWKGKLGRKEVKSPLNLFLMTYDIMRLHHKQVQQIEPNHESLALGSGREIVLGYFNQPGALMDTITIAANRGMVTEVLYLPRERATNTMEETTISIRNYRSLLLQRQLDGSEEPECYPLADELDIQNAAITVWRARSFK